MLVGQGARVNAFVRYNSRGDDGNLRHLPDAIRSTITVDFGDLRDGDAVATAVQGAEVIFHLGALIAIPYSYRHPREVVETNVLGTLNVLEAARTAKPARVVHISTSEVYGTAQRVPIDEAHPLQGQSPYSASKIGADKIAESYHRAFDVPVVTVRPFNTYGPRQSARAVIPATIIQALERSEIRLGALRPTRDFTYVEDTARGMMLAALAPDVEGREINLGSGAEITIGDLADRIVRIVGRDVPITSDEDRLRPGKSEVERLHADNTLAGRLLGWEPEVALDDGLRRTVAWISDHADAFRADEYQV
jgi:dTDP-glucose 4,6-dehydratase